MKFLPSHFHSVSPRLVVSLVFLVLAGLAAYETATHIVAATLWGWPTLECRRNGCHCCFILLTGARVSISSGLALV